PPRLLFQHAHASTWIVPNKPTGDREPDDAATDDDIVAASCHLINSYNSALAEPRYRADPTTCQPARSVRRSPRCGLDPPVRSRPLRARPWPPQQVGGWRRRRPTATLELRPLPSRPLACGSGPVGRNALSFPVPQPEAYRYEITL